MKTSNINPLVPTKSYSEQKEESLVLNKDPEQLTTSRSAGANVDEGRKSKEVLSMPNRPASLTNMNMHSFMNLEDPDWDSTYLPQTTIKASRSARTMIKRKENKALDLLGIYNSQSNGALLLNGEGNPHQMISMTDSDDSELCEDELTIFANQDGSNSTDECMKSASYDLHNLGVDSKNVCHSEPRRSQSDLGHDEKLKKKLCQLNDIEDGKRDVKKFNLMHLMVKQGMCTSRSFNSVQQISKYQTS